MKTTFHGFEIDGCLLVLSSAEFRRWLPEAAWIKGLKRGKGIRRRKEYELRCLNTQGQCFGNRNDAL